MDNNRDEDNIEITNVTRIDIYDDDKNKIGHIEFDDYSVIKFYRKKYRKTTAETYSWKELFEFIVFKKKKKCKACP